MEPHGYKFLELLIKELKKLVAWGADPKRLAVCPTLRDLAGVSQEASMMIAGRNILRYLQRAIGALDGAHEFQGRYIEADRLKRALYSLLLVDGRLAQNRRYQAMTVLEVYCSDVQWRRAGPEWNLLAILAESMTKPPGLQN